MAVTVSINYEGEHEGSCHTIELPDEALNAINIALGNIDLSNYVLKSELFSGSYNDLTDKPILVT